VRLRERDQPRFQRTGALRIAALPGKLDRQAARHAQQRRAFVAQQHQRHVVAHLRGELPQVVQQRQAEVAQRHAEPAQRLLPLREVGRLDGRGQPAALRGQRSHLHDEILPAERGGEMSDGIVLRLQPGELRRAQREVDLLVGDRHARGARQRIAAACHQRLERMKQFQPKKKEKRVQVENRLCF